MGEQARSPMVVMAGVMLALFLAGLNQMMVATASPGIVAALGGLELYSWVFASYMLTSTVLVPIYGKLSDLYGRRPIFLLGISLFLVGAFASGFAQTMPQLIALRGLQGLGAGAIFPIAFAIVGDLFAPAERGRVQGLIGAAFGVASLLGPLAGGWITDHVSWRWVFWVNVPVGIVSLAVAAYTLPRKQRVHGPVVIDYAGAALLVGAITPLMLLATMGGHVFAWGSPTALGLGAATLVCGAAFLWVEARAAEPIVPLSLFRNDVFSVSVAASFLVGVLMFGNSMFLPLFLQGVAGASATTAGLVMTPLMLSTVVSSTLAGQISSRTGRYRLLTLGGVGLMALGTFLLSLLAQSSPIWHVTAAAVVMGLGLGVTFPIFLLAVQNAAPPAQMGVVTSLIQFFRSIGGALGVAVLGAALTHHTFTQMSSRFPGMRVPEPQMLLTPGGAASLAPETLAAMREALAHALHLVFSYGFGVALLAVAVTWFLRELPLRSAPHAPSAAELGQELAADALVVPGTLRPEDEPDLIDGGCKSSS